MQDFCVEYRADWHSTSLPFGFERIQKRNAAQLERMAEAERRLSDYLAGRADTIEELDEAVEDFGAYSPNPVTAW